MSEKEQLEIIVEELSDEEIKLLIEFILTH